MEKKGLVLAVSGKGGTGKTSLAALMIKVLSESGNRSILAIDADPDSNLSNVLGFPVTKTVGEALSNFKKELDKGEVLPTMIKKDLLESRIFEVLEETRGFDIMTIGRTEGAGCYCAVNDFLTDIIDTLSKNYDLTVIDMEAGLEHLSRRTDRGVDIMVIVTDPSALGFQTAKRIKELAKEVRIDFKKVYLVGNRSSHVMENMILKISIEFGIELAGAIPEDKVIQEFNLKGKSMIELPLDNPALAAVKKIVERIGLA